MADCGWRIIYNGFVQTAVFRVTNVLTIFCKSQVFYSFFFDFLMLCLKPNRLKTNNVFMKLQIYNNIAKQGVGNRWVQEENRPSRIPVTDKSSSRSGQCSPVPSQIISILFN